RQPVQLRFVWCIHVSTIGDPHVIKVVKRSIKFGRSSRGSGHVPPPDRITYGLHVSVWITAVAIVKIKKVCQTKHFPTPQREDVEVTSGWSQAAEAKVV